MEKKTRRYINVQKASQMSGYCGKGKYCCLAYHPERDLLLMKTFYGDPSRGWIDMLDGLIFIGVFDQNRRMKMKEIKEWVDQVLEEKGYE